MSKDEKYLKSAQVCKCKFITDGLVTHKGMLIAGLVCLLIAVCFGVLFTLIAGWGVVLIALLASVFVIFYSKFTFIGLGEFAVGITYGPLLFEGVYYVMTGSFSLDVLILSLGVSPFVIAFLYTHTILDYDGDLCSHKKTLACRIGDKNKALILLGIFFAIGFISLGALTIMSGNFLYLAGFLTLPYIIWLFKELRQFNSDKTVIPCINKLNFPLDNWEQVVKDGAESFYFRLLLSRNIMMYMAIILILAITLGA